MTTHNPPLTDKLFNAVVIITGLGFMVDLYDLFIFNITRVAILTEMGVTGSGLAAVGLTIVNYQMLGLLLGGIFFGVLGDRLGRKQSLLGSILLYSAATLACGFAEMPEQMMALRFLAGFGLAGEVGVGVALITESMSKEKRGLGVTVFTLFGLLGIILAAWAAEHMYWRNAYIVGGIAGLALLITRSLVFESGLYAKSKNAGPHVERGKFLDIVRTPALRANYLRCIFMGTPIYFVLVFFTLSPEIAKATNVVGAEAVRAALAFAVGYGAASLVDVLVGFGSQLLKSRRKMVLVNLSVTALVLASFMMYGEGITAQTFYLYCALFGISVGYFVNMITTAAELFGTNLRATAATTVPNFSRATMIPLNLAIMALKPEWGVLWALGIVGAASIVIAVYCVWTLPETFGKDLDYHN